MNDLSTVFIDKSKDKAYAMALSRLKFMESADKIKINPEKPSNYDYMRDASKGSK